jgi:hypothetical protein
MASERSPEGSTGVAEAQHRRVHRGSNRGEVAPCCEFGPMLSAIRRFIFPAQP